jgi:DNA-binding NarL/FixJ family response regulator
MMRDLVLLVDDAPDELQMLIEAVESAGFTAVAATNSLDALKQIGTIAPRLIVLDAVMPGIDGFELCRMLKANPHVAHVPIMFMTGLTDTGHVIEGLQAGAVDYVTKPVIIEELIARMAVHMANARVAQGARIGLDATGRHLLALDRSGAILWCTPQAASTLGELFPDSNPAQGIAMPDLQQQLSRLVAETPSDSIGQIVNSAGRASKIEFLCESGPAEFLFRLSPVAADAEESRLARNFQLTDREGEVLVWTARGKSNREISEILLISPRTVNKHLERIFMKLGVENRASATSVAMRVLLGRD